MRTLEPQRFWLSADPAEDLLVFDERPSLSVFDALVAAPDDVSLVFRDSLCESAEPAADLLLEAVEPLLNVLDAAVAALDDVVLPAMSPPAGMMPVRDPPLRSPMTSPTEREGQGTGYRTAELACGSRFVLASATSS